MLGSNQSLPHSHYSTPLAKRVEGRTIMIRILCPSVARMTWVGVDQKNKSGAGLPSSRVDLGPDRLSRFADLLLHVYCRSRDRIYPKFN